MPRKKYEPAPDADRREVDCKLFSRSGGVPRCCALTHPWCCADGNTPEACSFRAPREADNETD